MRTYTPCSRQQVRTQDLRIGQVIRTRAAGSASVEMSPMYLKGKTFDGAPLMSVSVRYIQSDSQESIIATEDRIWTLLGKVS